MLERCPQCKPYSVPSIKLLLNPEYISDIERINRDYLYWDKVKYKVPEGVSAEVFWNAIQLSRRIGAKTFSFPFGSFSYKGTIGIEEILHEFDRNIGTPLFPNRDRQSYVLNSIMEEAIASSRMEGALTTRIEAKEMLRKGTKPMDVSQRMILNNYNTIRFLSGHKYEELTSELILEIHRRITERTLGDSSLEGHFRKNDSIYVLDEITGDVAHNPPSFTLIDDSIKAICDFVNCDKDYIHPVIKAIMLHFFISYLHPFADGNGRTARALFYWYMLKKGYWLTEFLSISRVIYRSKAQYEKAFLYTETDGFNLGYFVSYNLNVLKKAFDELTLYLERKGMEEKDIMNYRIPSLNERQMRILRICERKPSAVFTAKELLTRFSVTVKTLRSDLEGLVLLGLMETVPLNRRLIGYTGVKDLETRLQRLKEPTNNLV